MLEEHDATVCMKQAAFYRGCTFRRARTRASAASAASKLWNTGTSSASVPVRSRASPPSFSRRRFFSDPEPDPLRAASVPPCGARALRGVSPGGQHRQPVCWWVGQSHLPACRTVCSSGTPAGGRQMACANNFADWTAAVCTSILLSLLMLLG